MMQIGPEHSQRQLNTPEEELAYLREQVRRREEQMRDQHESRSGEHGRGFGGSEIEEGAARATIAEYSRSVLQDGAYHSPEAESLVRELALSPESHDVRMAQLIAMVRAKGARSALLAIDKLDNPHLQDDFHRILARYIATGHSARGLKENRRMWQALHMTLYEITLPEDVLPQNDRAKPLKEALSSMEQFYAGMLSVADKASHENLYFTVELALPHIGEEVNFYVAVPTSKRELFEKHVLSVFPRARLEDMRDDYNIFNQDGAAAGARARLAESPALPLRTYEQFDYDPLNVLVNAFSKIKREGEGAAIQLVFKPEGERYVRKYRGAVRKLERGETRARALRFPEDIVGKTALIVEEIFGKRKPAPPNPADPMRQHIVDSQAIEQVLAKISSPIVSCNLRLMTSALSLKRAEELLNGLQSAFNQFANTGGNSLRFERARRGSLRRLLRSFSFRAFSRGQAMPLSLREVTTLAHFGGADPGASHQLKRIKAGSAPAPASLPSYGVVLGLNRFRGEIKEVSISDDDRLRHFYLIGQTGTGKSTLLKNMIAQDVLRGAGVAMIDPHGSDIQDILSIVPRERYEDVIYFDPGYTARPMGLNMLEYDERFPEQKTFVVNELFNIFRKLYGAVPESMGPAFEQYFRNATLLTIEDPASGNTLIDVSRVLSDKGFRDFKLSRCRNPIVVQFWREIAEKAGGEASLANIVPYVTNKFDVFLANDIMRPIIGQARSSFNFREVMDQRKILLVNLSKGRLGDINANLIGLILVGKILMAALSRVDSLGAKLPPYYLFLDEFQNITTNSIAIILSEARKYGLSLTMAHQFIAQLADDIREAVFGNVGSMCAFRVGAEDSQILEKQFGPEFSAHDLMNIDNHNAYLKLLIEGRPAKPFNIETAPFPEGISAQVDQLKQMSYLKYGRDREQVERDIAERYHR